MLSLFPPEMGEGYQLTGHLPESKKMPGIRLRQLRTHQVTYTIRPSFVFSYMSGTVSDLEHSLLLLSLGVPCWAIMLIFGRNEMYCLNQKKYHSHWLHNPQVSASLAGKVDYT